VRNAAPAPEATPSAARRTTARAGNVAVVPDF